jgi:Ca-activated chloride channel family protein
MPFVDTTLNAADVEQLPEEKQGHGTLKTAQGNLPLKQMDVKAVIVGLLCRTTVRQTYVNSTGQPLEATYIFPLPDRAGVTRFRMEVGERVIEGDLQERAKARQNYAAAITAGHRAAIAEEERPDVFTMRVGNIPPGEEVTVWLDMAGPLETSAGCATFRFPLVVAPRYVPGLPLLGTPVGTGTSPDTDQVPDASRITPPTLLPGYKSPVQLDLHLSFDPAGLKTSNPRTTMPVEEGVETGSERRTLQLKPGQRLNQDFVFRFNFLAKETQATLVIERDAHKPKEGTLLLTVVGPDQRNEAPPKDVIFVLDRSGSMQGWKMVAARRACADLIDKLGPQDRFDVLAFDTAIEHPFTEAGMRQATPHNRYVATEFLSRVGARGGTEIARPLFAALQGMLPVDEREQTIVLITDGQVGNDRGVLKLVQDNLGGAQGRRIHTLGIDRCVSAGFLKSLADAGDGRFELVESPERLAEVLDSFARQIGGPFLTDMEFAVGGLGLDMGSVAPAAGHHLYPNVPTLVMARFVGLGEPEYLKASIAGVLPEVLGPEIVHPEPILAPAWARRRVRELEDEWASSPDSDTEQEIVALSLKHKVLCRFTAFVAIDKSAVVNPGGSQVQVTQPVEQPEGWDMLNTGGGIVMGQAIGNYGGGGQMYGGGGTMSSLFCSTQGMGGYSGVQGSTGAQGAVGPVGQSFHGFAPGFEPMARRSRGPGGQHVNTSRTYARNRRSGGGMRCVPIPNVNIVTLEQLRDLDRRNALELVAKLLKGKKKGKKFWKGMQDLADMLIRLVGQSDPRAISAVLCSTLNTAIAAKKWTPRTQQTLETIKAELERTLDPNQAGQPRPVNKAFWK